MLLLVEKLCKLCILEILLEKSTSFLDINAEQFQFCFLWQILLNEPNLKTEKNT